MGSQFSGESEQQESTRTEPHFLLQDGRKGIDGEVMWG